MAKRAFVVTFLAMSWLALAAAAVSAADDTNTRVATWAIGAAAGGRSFQAQTVRMVVHPSASGRAPRLRLSNLYSTGPLNIAHATLSVQSKAATLQPGSLHALTVGGKTSFTIPAGSEIWTDPVPMRVAAGQNLAVSLYLPETTAASTWHQDAFETTYATMPGAGDHATDINDDAFKPIGTSWYYVSAMTVEATGSRTVVAFGDSITDGYKTPVSANARWPDVLSRRLVAAGKPVAVANVGIGGNRLLTDGPDPARGISALHRFDHDVLSLPNVRTVILLEGINDIGADAGPDGRVLTAADLIDGYRQLIRQARRAGVRIIGATILPSEGSGYFSETREATRQAANTWIRTSGAFDGVVDFDKAVRDPQHPRRLLPLYDAGDHLHPNAAGMQAMGESIDLHLPGL